MLVQISCRWLDTARTWLPICLGLKPITSVQCSHSVVYNSATPWTGAHQASLSFTIFQSLHKYMSIESMMPSNHLILCYPLLLLQSFPASGSILMSQLFTSGGQSNGASASGKVLSVNIQDWFPLGLIGLISLLSKGALSNTTVPKYQFFSTRPSL